MTTSKLGGEFYEWVLKKLVPQLLKECFTKLNFVRKSYLMI